MTTVGRRMQRGNSVLTWAEAEKEDAMSIFGKKAEGEHAGSDDTQVGVKAATPRYGIGDVISLLRTLPLDQDGELVVRVIRTTLESLKVRVSDLVQDASKRQQELSQRIGALQGKILELTKQIDAHRDEVTRLEADLAETTNAKERLQFAEQNAKGAATQPIHSAPPGAVHATPLPPPMPPPLRPAPPRPPEALHHDAKD